MEIYLSLPKKYNHIFQILQMMKTVTNYFDCYFYYVPPTWPLSIGTISKTNEFPSIHNLFNASVTLYVLVLKPYICIIIVSRIKPVTEQKWNLYYPTIKSHNASVAHGLWRFFPPLLPQETLLRKITFVRYRSLPTE